MRKEEMKYADFWNKLDRYIVRSGMMPMFDDARRGMTESEYAYDKARTLLDPETEDDLVLYVGYCEEFCRTFALAAYEMGRAEGTGKEE